MSLDNYRWEAEQEARESLTDSLEKEAETLRAENHRLNMELKNARSLINHLNSVIEDHELLMEDAGEDW